MAPKRTALTKAVALPLVILFVGVLIAACNDAEGEESAATDEEAAEAAMVAVRAVSAGFQSAAVAETPTAEGLEQQRRELEEDRMLSNTASPDGDTAPATIEIDGASSTFHLTLDGYGIQDILGEAAGPYTRASGNASMAPGAVFTVDLQLSGGPVGSIAFVLDPQQFAAAGNVLEAEVNGVARSFEVDASIFTGRR